MFQWPLRGGGLRPQWHGHLKKKLRLPYNKWFWFVTQVCHLSVLIKGLLINIFGDGGKGMPAMHILHHSPGVYSRVWYFFLFFFVEHRLHKILIWRAFYSPRLEDFKTVFFFFFFFFGRLFLEYFDFKVWDPL